MFSRILLRCFSKISFVVFFFLVGPNTAMFGQPENDLCAIAFELPNVSGSSFELGSTIGKTNTDAPENCWPGVDNQAGIGVWYKVSVGAGQTFFASAAEDIVNPGEELDLELSLYTGTCDNLVCIISNDDVNDEGGPLLYGVAQEPTTYFLYVNSKGGNEGEFRLTSQVYFTPSRYEENDLCFGAEEILVPEGGVGTVEGVFNSPEFDGSLDYGFGVTPVGAPPNCGEGVDFNLRQGVWYCFTGEEGTSYEISTCNEIDESQFDTQIGVYTGDCRDLICVDGNDDDLNCTSGTGTVLSTLIVNPFTTTKYYIYLSNNGEDLGTGTGFQLGSGTGFQLSITDLGPIPGFPVEEIPLMNIFLLLIFGIIIAGFVTIGLRRLY